MVMEYCKVLIVGDGDLSNSVHLLSQYCGSCLTSTVFLSKKDLVKVYGEVVESNVNFLQSRGVKVLYSVDANKLSADVKASKYDSIIFNFPHSGGKSDINKNRTLLRKMFKSFLTVLKSTGKVIITLLPGQGGTPADGKHLRIKGNSWNVQDSASQSGFILELVEDFDTKKYNLTGYKSSSKAFFCNTGIRHIFKHQPFRSKSVRKLIQCPVENSYLEKHLKNFNILPSCLKLKINGCVGTFDQLVSIILDEALEHDEVSVESSKRIKLSGSNKTSDIGYDVMGCYELMDRKSIYYPANATRVLFPPKISHDVSFWTDSEDIPNIVSLLLDCVGLAFHEITHKEVFYKEETGKYAHNFRITYSHPFEALSEDLVKSLAHDTLRKSLEDSGYGLH